MPMTLEELQNFYADKNEQIKLVEWVKTQDNLAFCSFFENLSVKEKMDFFQQARALASSDFNDLSALAGLKIDRDELMQPQLDNIKHFPKLFDLVPGESQPQQSLTPAHYFLVELFMQRFELIVLTADDEAFYSNISNSFLAAFIALCYPVTAFYSIEKTPVNDNSLYDALDRKKLFGFDLAEKTKTYISECFEQACALALLGEELGENKQEALNTFINDMGLGKISTKITLDFVAAVLERSIYSIP